MIELDSLDEYDRLPVTNWGIKQFSNEDLRKEDAIDLDLILLPGLAFDLAKSGCKRLGKGGGYYDTYLAKLKERTSWHNKMPYLIGLAFKEQLREVIPTTETDFKIDEIITS